MQRRIELAWNGAREEPNYVINRRRVFDAQDLALVDHIGSEDEDEEFHDWFVVTPEWTRQFRTRPLYVELEEGFVIFDSNPLRIVSTNVPNPGSRRIVGVFEIRLPDLSQEGLVELPLPLFDPVARIVIAELDMNILTLENSLPVAQQLGVPYVPPPVRRDSPPQRRVELAWNHGGEPNYVINRREFFDAEDLGFIDEILSPEDQEDFSDWITVTPEWTRQFRTRPLYLSFEEEGFAILDSNPLRIVNTNVPNPASQRLIATTEILIPDLSQEGLIGLPLPPFNSVARTIIEELNTNTWTLENSVPIAQQLGVPYVPPPVLRGSLPPGIAARVGFPRIPEWAIPTTAVSRAQIPPFTIPASAVARAFSPSPSPRREIPPPQESPILEALIARLYGLPVAPPQALIVNGLPVPLIPFAEATGMLQRNEVERYTIDPLNQVWAGPPGTTNRIVTLIRRDGTLSAVLAKYDPTTGQIFTPN